MKTAVSIPNELFTSADKMARRLGVTRSELYAAALSQLLTGQSQQQITDRLNLVYSRQRYRLDPAIRAARRKALPKEDW